MTAVPMIRLTTVTGSFAAHVLAARLTDEGFDVQLRGALVNTYGLTMGAMAAVDVFVPEDQVAEASYVLLVNEVDYALDEEPDERRRQRARQVKWPWRCVAAAIIVSGLWPAVHALRMLGIETNSPHLPALTTR